MQTVSKLDQYFSELNRLGAKIESLDMKSDFDFEQAERLIHHFTECGHGVSEEVVNLSNALHSLRAEAESYAQVVGLRAQELQSRKSDIQTKMASLRDLGDKVRQLTESLSDLKKMNGEEATEEDRARISMRLSSFEIELKPLIEESQKLQEEGRRHRIKILEQSADSLRQSLIAISQKLSGFQTPNSATH